MASGGKVIYELILQARNFDRELKRSEARIAHFERQLVKANQAIYKQQIQLDRLGREAMKTTATMNRFGNGIVAQLMRIDRALAKTRQEFRFLQGGIRDMGMAGTFNFSLPVGIGMAKVVKDFAQMEAIRIKLPSLFKSSVADFAPHFEDILTRITASPAIALKDAEPLIQRLALIGIPKEKVAGWIDSMGPLKGILGADMGRLGKALLDVKTHGSLEGPEVKQFANQFIPIYDVLARHINSKMGLSGMDMVTTKMIKDMEASGTRVGPQLVLDAIKDTKNTYPLWQAAYEKYANSLTGKSLKMADSFYQLSAEIGDMISSGLGLKEIITYMTDGMIAMKDWLREIRETNPMMAKFVAWGLAIVVVMFPLLWLFGKLVIGAALFKLALGYLMSGGVGAGILSILVPLLILAAKMILVVAAIYAVGYALTWLYDWGTGIDWGRMWDDFSESLGNVKRDFLQLMDDLQANPVFNFFMTIVSKIAEGWGLIFKAMKDGFDEHMENRKDSTHNNKKRGGGAGEPSMGFFEYYGEENTKAILNNIKYNAANDSTVASSGGRNTLKISISDPGGYVEDAEAIGEGVESTIDSEGDALGNRSRKRRRS